MISRIYTFMIFNFFHLENQLYDQKNISSIKMNHLLFFWTLKIICKISESFHIVIFFEIAWKKYSWFIKWSSWFLKKKRTMYHFLSIFYEISTYEVDDFFFNQLRSMFIKLMNLFNESFFQNYRKIWLHYSANFLSNIKVVYITFHIELYLIILDDIDTTTSVFLYTILLQRNDQYQIQK